VNAGLYLTSMVDMFAIMVIFLLQSFSAEGELIVLPKGLELPKAMNSGILEKAPSLVVSLEEILFQGEKVGDTKAVLLQDEWIVPALQEKLKVLKESLDSEAKARALASAEKVEDEPKETMKINISVDRRLPFEIARKIIYNASFAGFPDSRLAVFGGKPKIDP